MQALPASAHEVRKRVFEDAGDGDAVAGFEAGVPGGSASLGAGGAADQRALFPEGSCTDQRIFARARSRWRICAGSMAVSVMAEMVQTLVGEAERKIVDENALKPAGQPRYEFPGRQGRDGKRRSTPRPISPSRLHWKSCRNSSLPTCRTSRCAKPRDRGDRQGSGRDAAAQWRRRTAASTQCRRARGGKR